MTAVSFNFFSLLYHVLLPSLEVTKKEKRGEQNVVLGHKGGLGIFCSSFVSSCLKSIMLLIS